MLKAIYDGHHSLDLEALFRNVAWSSLYYGGVSIDDPLVSCLSHFKRLCSELHVQLDSVYKWNQWNQDWLESTNDPYLLIISGNPSIELQQIFDLVKNGSNLLVTPPPIQIVENISNGTLLDAHKLFLEALENQLNFSFGETEEINFGDGKVFYLKDANQINDLLLEPGPFGGFKESEKEEKEEKIRSLIKRITTFNVPCVSCQVRSVPLSWPQDQSLVIEIDVTQHSVFTLKEVVIVVEIPSSFEPLSTTEIQIKDLQPHLNRSVALLVSPRAQGNYCNPISIIAIVQGKRQQLFLPDSQVEIIRTLPELLRASHPVSVDIAELLPQYELKIRSVTTASKLIELINIDPDAAVVKVRKVGEYVCKNIARQYLQNYSSKSTFADTTKKLFSASILPPKAKGYIDTIRGFGNLAAHAGEPSVTNFEHEDALATCYALVLFLKEVTEVNLI